MYGFFARYALTPGPSEPSPTLYIIRKSLIFTLELSQKSDFQPSTTKPDNIGHPTIKTEQIRPWGDFEGGFAICPILTVEWPMLSDFVVEG